MSSYRYHTKWVLFPLYIFMRRHKTYQRVDQLSLTLMCARKSSMVILHIINDEIYHHHHHHWGGYWQPFLHIEKQFIYLCLFNDVSSMGSFANFQKDLYSSVCIIKLEVNLYSFSISISSSVLSSFVLRYLARRSTYWRITLVCDIPNYLCVA